MRPSSETQLDAGIKCPCNVSEINIQFTKAVAHYTNCTRDCPLNALCERILWFKS